MTRSQFLVLFYKLSIFGVAFSFEFVLGCLDFNRSGDELEDNQASDLERQRRLDHSVSC